MIEIIILDKHRSIPLSTIGKYCPSLKGNLLVLGLQVPSYWYEVHIVVPDELEVTGLTDPGIPQVMSGHNTHTAWALTNVPADVVDVFVEEINP